MRLDWLVIAAVVLSVPVIWGWAAYNDPKARQRRRIEALARKAKRR